MKKYLIISILSLIFAVSLSAETIKKYEFNSNPINVAVVIVEKGDSAKIADIFDYYGYTLQGNEDGYHIMKDPKGNEIRYTFQEVESLGKFPIVVVRSKEKTKDIESRLENLQFKKVGDLYQRTINYDRNLLTQCIFGTDNNLVFQRHIK